jgi:hypothetical protein
MLMFIELDSPSAAFRQVVCTYEPMVLIVYMHLAAYDLVEHRMVTAFLRD